ncbi:MAG: hypothetical protein JXR34_00465 [Bacteroidales bacterium]|nr:hypothetical protein [Bacteroidales bacterium]
MNKTKTVVLNKKLKLKIFSSFMLLTILLAAAGTVSILEFRKLSSVVNDIINDNYKSIEASKRMVEALERIDSGVLLLTLGEWIEGRKTIEYGDSLFLNAFHYAKNNITEDQEVTTIKSIELSYRNFQEKFNKPIVGTDREGNIAWYKENTHKWFLVVKRDVNQLMTINQSNMYVEAYQLRDKSTRAMMPGIVSIIAALIFSLLLNYFVSKYFISPLVELSTSIEDFRPGDIRLKCDIKSDDELKRLEDSINGLIQNITKYNR